MKEFIPNIDSKKHKKKVTKYSCNFKWCKSKKECRHVALIDPVTSDWICKKCHCIFDHTMINKDQSKVKNQEILIWNREYDKSRWIYNGLEYLNGNFNHYLNDLCWLELLQEIPNPCVWYDIYHVFHKYRMTDFWTCFPSYIGMSPNLNRTIIYHVLKYCDLGYTKYRISYLYLVYKFTQLFGSIEEARKIPIKGSKGWIKKTDAWWKEICKQNSWTFIETEKVQIEWQKEYILTALICLRQKSIKEIG